MNVVKLSFETERLAQETEISSLRSQLDMALQRISHYEQLLGDRIENGDNHQQLQIQPNSGFDSTKSPLGSDGQTVGSRGGNSGSSGTGYSSGTSSWSSYLFLGYFFGTSSSNSYSSSDKKHVIQHV